MERLIEILSRYYSCYYFFALSLLSGFIVTKKRKVVFRTLTGQILYWVILSVSYGIMGFGLQYFLQNDMSLSLRILLSAVASVIAFLWGIFMPEIIRFFRRKAEPLYHRHFSPKIGDNLPGLLFFGILTVRYIIRLPECVRWPMWSYAVNYSMGFGSRFFVGSVLFLLTGGHVTGKAVKILCFAVSLMIIGTVSFLLNAFIKNSNPETKNAAWFLTVCYLVSPASVSSFWSDENYGRLDMFIFLTTILSVIAFRKIRNIYAKYAVLALSCLICNLIYQGFIFMSFSLIVIVIINDIFSEKKLSVKKILLAGGVFFITAISFLGLQFFKSVNFESVEEMVAYMTAESDIEFSADPIKAEFFQSSLSLYQYMYLTLEANANLREELFLHVIFFIPQIVLFLWILIGSIQKRKDRKLGLLRSVVFLSCLTVLFILPQYIMNIDWGRWTTSAVTTVYFIVMYLSYTGNMEMNNTLTELSSEIERKRWLYLLLPIYTATFTVLQAEALSSDYCFLMGILSTIKNYMSSLF